MSILVTGAAGFIGQHLVHALRSAGQSVIALDRRPGGDWQLDLTQAAIADFDGMGPVEQIYHLACPASPVEYSRDPLDTFNAAVFGTRLLTELADRKQARLLLASTSEIYGDPLEHPQREDYWGNVDCRGPRACYDEGKRAAETLLTLVAHRIETRTARIFNTYGPGMRLDDGRVIPAFMDALVKGQPLPVVPPGTQTRSFCYISDLVCGLIKLMNSEISEPVNLGNPAELTILELAATLQEVTGITAEIAWLPPREGEPRQRRPDIRRAKQCLDWQPEVDLRAGLAATWQWVQEQTKSTKE